MHAMETESCLHTGTILGNDVIYVVDGNAMLQAIVKLPQTYVKLAEMVFQMLPKTLKS